MSDKVIIAASYPRKFKIGAWIIATYQQTKYSHVLAIKGGVVYEASHGKVHKRPLNDFLTEHKLVFKKEVDSEKVDLEYLELMAEEAVDYGEFQLVKIGFSILFGKIFRDNGDRKLICSEYIGRALRLKVDDYFTPKQLVEILRSL